MTMRGKAAIAGVGATPYYKRGASHPQTLLELVGKAAIAAVGDAGLRMTDIDGFAFYAHGFDPGLLMEMLGIPDISFSAMITGTGGGSAGSIGLAASAVVSGQARNVLCIGAVQQAAQRFGTIVANYEPTPEDSFLAPAGLVTPGHMFAMLAMRHMHQFGTTREHFAEVALNARANARTHPRAVMRKPLTLDDYMASPLIADPLCLYDFCLESDGAVACVVTNTEHARDLRQPPVLIRAGVHGGERGWGRSLYWMNMPDDLFVSSGHGHVARRLYAAAGLGPEDIDVAQIYDHFGPQVIAQLEDYGFCKRGEGGPFVASGAIRLDGRIPINTDGGQMSGGYIWGMGQVLEAVEQLRGTAVNQVSNAEVALVTGGPSNVPVSALVLTR